MTRTVRSRPEDFLSNKTSLIEVLQRPLGPLLVMHHIHLRMEHYREYASPYFPEYPWGDYADDGSIVVAKESI